MQDFHLNCSTPAAAAAAAAAPTGRRRAGFSFAEVMFAVIILGVGFIMVAAIFPVAIQQTKLTADESAAAAVARNAAATIERLAVGSETAGPGSTPLFPPTQLSGANNVPRVFPIRAGWPPVPGGGTLPPPELWNLLRGNLIIADDPRFAWTAVYSRGRNEANQPEPFIRVYIFVLQNRQRPTFDTRDITAASGLVNLQARKMLVRVFGPDPANPADPAYVQFTTAQQWPTLYQDASFEGAFLVTAAGTAANEVGRVLRLGVRRAPDKYEVDPAYTVAPGPPSTAEVWFVGPGLKFVEPVTNPPVITNPPRAEGDVMDVALYTTFVRVN